MISPEQLNEAELEVDSDKASYKQKLEVLQQQEELIEDEEEQEQKEEDARRAKKEAEERSKREEEAQMAESLLPDSEVRFDPWLSLLCWSLPILTMVGAQLHPERFEEEDARMTTEQLKELGEALSILSAKSSVLKERDELRALMEENSQAEEVRYTPAISHLSTTHRLLTLLTLAGPQVSFSSSDQTHPHNAHQDRRPAFRVRCPCR